MGLMQSAPPMPKTGIGAIVFGLATLVTGGATLFAGLDMGNTVAFVLWFNALAGLAYVVAGMLIARGLPGATALAAVLALATLAVFAVFLAHVAAGGAYELRTIGAMILRSGFWIVVTALLWRNGRAVQA